MQSYDTKKTSNTKSMLNKPASVPGSEQATEPSYSNMLSFGHPGTRMDPTPLPPAGRAFPVSAGTSIQDMMKGFLKQMALDILLEAALKLSGMDRSIANTFVPVIKLIQEARAVISSAEGNLTDRLKELTVALNTARNSLKVASPDSVIFRGTDILCDVADVLHKGLTASDLSELGGPLEKLGRIIGLDSVLQGAKRLTDLAKSLYQWTTGNITGTEMTAAILGAAGDRIPEILRLPLRIGEKLALAIQAGKLPLKDAQPWPGTEDKLNCLKWLTATLQSDSLRDILTSADYRWLKDHLDFDDEEAEYTLKELLPLVRFPVKGSPAEQLAALQTLPFMSNIGRKMDISLNDNLGIAGSLLKDKTTLSKLGGVLNASGTAGKSWEALKLVDSGKALNTLKNLSLETLKKVFGVAADAGSLVWLVLKKAHAFLKSAYSPGQSISDPVRLYRDLIAFIQKDVQDHPGDYKNATIETLLATVAVTLRSLGGNHVPINWSGNTAEWLKAYAEADPDSLTAVDKVLMHAVLEPRAVLEVKNAIQQKDPVQARKMLEPLSDALKSYVGDSPVLRQIANTLPYIPAVTAAWKEIQAMDLRERAALAGELQQQSELHTNILHNSRKRIAPETLSQRQARVVSLQEKLQTLQKKSGVDTGQGGVLQAELDAMKLAIKTLPEKAQPVIAAELEGVQANLDNLKKLDALNDIPDEARPTLYATQVAINEDMRTTLAEEGVSPSEMMKAQLSVITSTLNDLPTEIKLTEMGSVVHFAAEALTRLATSTDPSLVSVKAELATLVRNTASDMLADVVRWSLNQMMKLFTKEVELSPEEKDLGLFVIERDLSVWKLAAGAAAGAASGGLFSALYLLLSGESLPGLTRGDASSENAVMQRTAPEGITGPRGITAQSDQQIVRLSRSVAGLYNNTTEPLPQESNNMKKWLMLTAPVAAGAVAGAGIAAAMNPAIREKRGQDDSLDEPDLALTISGQLHTFTRKDGVTLGIHLQPGQRLVHYKDEKGQLKTYLEDDTQYPTTSGSFDERSASGESDTPSHSSPRSSRKKRDMRYMLKSLKNERSTNKRLENEREKLYKILALRKQLPQQRTDHNPIKRSLPAVKVKNKISEFGQSVNAGIFDRFGPDLNAPEFIDAYIKNFIDEYPGNNGNMTPDTLLRLTANGNEAISSYHTLRDLVRGKVNYEPLTIKWDKNVHDDLKKKLLPYSERLGYDPNKRSVQKKFNEIMAANKASPYFKGDLKAFYNVSLISTAMELKSSPSVPQEFKSLLGSYINGELKPMAMSFWGHNLTDTVAFRVGQKILAWDASGGHILFSDNTRGRTDPKVQQWISRHLEINHQTTFRADKFHDIRTFNNMLGTYDVQSPINLTAKDDVYEYLYQTIIDRAEKDMDTLVKTDKERMVDDVIDLAALGLNFAVTFAPGVSIGAVIVKSLLRAGIALLKGGGKALNADTYAEKTKYTEAAFKAALKGLLVDGVNLGTKLVEANYLKGDAPFLAPNMGKLGAAELKRMPAFVKELLDRTDKPF